MLVIDASTAIRSCGTKYGFETLGDTELVAPPLMWSECFSSVHAARWRRAISRRWASTLLNRLEASPVKLQHPAVLHREAWQVADKMGWAKTYDAEYVALARISECKLVTLDQRLRRGADRLGIVVTPDELS